jgi:phenylalanyl-tRNA synthetase beta chain
LLEKVHPNNKLGFDNFTLYELGKAHVNNVKDQDGLPTELERLAAVFTSKETDGGAPFFATRRYLEFLLEELRIKGVLFQKIDDNLMPDWQQAAQPFELSRSAAVYIGKDFVGIIGEPNQKIKQALKLPKYTAQFELDIPMLLKHVSSIIYQPLNRFPNLEQDFCLRSDNDIPYQQLADFIVQNLEKLTSEQGCEFNIKPIDIFQRHEDPKHKQTTWRVSMWHPQRTLTTEESNKVLDKLADSAKKELNAERI